MSYYATEVIVVPDYKAMYFRLAGKIADVIEILVDVQREGEDMAMEKDNLLLQMDEDSPDNITR